MFSLDRRAGPSFPVREQPLAKLQGIKLAPCTNLLLAPKHSWSGSHSERAKRFHALPSSRGQMRRLTSISTQVAKPSGLRVVDLRQYEYVSYDWVDLRCLTHDARENRGKVRRGKIRRKMSSVGRASEKFGVGHPKFQPGTFVPGSRFANRASFDANRAMCPVCPVLEWPLSLHFPLPKIRTFRFSLHTSRLSLHREVTMGALKFAMSSHFPLPKISSPQALFPLFQMARAARRVIENPRQMIKSCPVLFCSSHRKTESN